MGDGVRSSRSTRAFALQLCEIGLVLALVGFWALEYSRVILQSDDLLNAGLAGRPDARMSVSEWWQLYRHDYLQVNGRFTDAAVRVVLQGGRTAWAVVGPVLMAALVIGGCAWITGRVPGWRRHTSKADYAVLAVLGLCAALPLSIIALRPAAAGDGIFWLSAALTHLGSAVCILVGGWPFLAKVSGRPAPTAMLWIAPPFVVLANISQETASVTMLATIASCWLLLKGRVSRYLGLLSAASVAAFAYHVLSPGLLGRATAFQAQAADTLPLVQQLLHRGVVSAQIWLMMGAVGLVGVTVVATALLWVGVRRALVPRLTAIPLSALAILVLVATWTVGPWSDTFEVIPREAFTGDEIGEAAALAGVLVGACVFGLAATYLLRGLVGPVPFVLVTGGAAALAVPTALGITGERAYMISSLWWGFAAVCLLRAGARMLGPAATPVMGVVALGMLVALVPTAREINLAMTQNFVTWQATDAQIAAALDGNGETVTVGPFPYPDYMCWAAFDEPRYGDYFRLYYDLPSDVAVEFRPSPAGS
ncbi:hypothetical protein [Nocardioides allogilvus]|uniref:hypothetical protein n=1 Tax=Nocardioides allogilvus TaxID=2072017 RepID=UPI000D2F59D0|nr:hypothetical protein [Nocardioides allogilvus]